MPFKRPEDLSDQDIRGAVVFLLMQYQELEVILAEAVMVVMAAQDEVEQPTEAELQSTLSDLKAFLMRAHNRLKAISDTTDNLNAEMHSRN